jgi:hypothetical protein
LPAGTSMKKARRSSKNWKTDAWTPVFCWSITAAFLRTGFCLTRKLPSGQRTGQIFWMRSA